MTRVNNLESLLDSLVRDTSGETLRVETLLNSVGRRSYGPILLLLGFVAISPLTIIPGATWLVALLVLIVSVQIVLGLSHPWVPRRALDFEFRREHLLSGIEGARPWAQRIDQFLKPRLAFLTATPFAQLIAMVCIAAALITFPLGFVPFAPVLPGLAIMLFGLGLTARDGAFLIAAGLALAGGLFLLVRLWSRISGVFA